MKLNLITLIIGSLMILSFAACQRNNMPYGGVKTNKGAPAYDLNFNPNQPSSAK